MTTIQGELFDYPGLPADQVSAQEIHMKDGLTLVIRKSTCFWMSQTIKSAIPPEVTGIFRGKGNVEHAIKLYNLYKAKTT